MTELDAFWLEEQKIDVEAIAAVEPMPDGISLELVQAPKPRAR